jgi:PAS domain-containing protein
MPRLPFWRFEIATRTVIPSDACAALYGRTLDARIPYADYLDVIHPDDRERHRIALERAIGETGLFDVQYRIMWPDGSLHRAHSIGSVSVGDDGAPFEILGASIELTD